MAKEAGVHPTTIWRAHGLQPHRIEYFKLSTDPHFVEKLRWTASAQSIIAKVSKAKETLATQH